LEKKRLENILRKLEGSRMKAAYDEVFVNWLQEAIIEEIPISQWDEEWKEGGTTRVRPVFDASAKELPQNAISVRSRKRSLMGCLDQNTNFLPPGPPQMHH
jgi:hypothetical protein